ncbi:hypothetical protein [Lentibacillus salinarum]|uniref:Uncharacterized protein n=1 Tax=Lentibacillus salinarum TaxID=446820 RepID=A0ABW3ZUB3_9BACI
MNDEQQNRLAEIRGLKEKITQLQVDYWFSFSDFGTWQFWVVLAALIVPLIILILFIDRNNILLLLFFGINFHLWFQYVNAAQISMGLLEYPYEILPYLPSIALDGSIAPVSYILMYQWVLNHAKNIYLHATLLSAVFAFVAKPIIVSFGFFHMYKGLNYFHLFLFYLLFFFVSYAITRLFVWMQQKRAGRNSA